MAKKLSLGKGFDALIPKGLDSAILEEDKNRVQKVLISEVSPNPQQPRREFDKQALSELAASVKQYGVLQPIIVVRDQGSSRYKIVAGERRWRAARDAGLTHIPAIVRSLKELEQVELGLIENIQRVDLSPLEQALSVYRLQHQFNLSLSQIAEKLGKASSTISNLTRLLNLPDSAREALRTGKISEGHARTILALKGFPDKQAELLGCILNNGWSVRQAEQFVVDVKNSTKPDIIDRSVKELSDLSSRLTAELGTNVKIRTSTKEAQIIIQFKSLEQLDNISQRLLK